MSIGKTAFWSAVGAVISGGISMIVQRKQEEQDWDAELSETNDDYLSSPLYQPPLSSESESGSVYPGFSGGGEETVV